VNLDFARDLPKAELHVHLEGCLEPEMALAFARRNEIVLPWRTPAALAGAYQFDDLADFLAVFFHVSSVIVTEQDFYDLTRAYLRRAHADGVVRVEASISPQGFLERGVAISALMNGTLQAMADAEDEDGLSTGLIIGVQRHRSEPAAFDLLDMVTPWAENVVAFGLASAEVGNPPSKFASFFAEVHRQAFRTCAHAGEEGPASYVREAVEVLGVERIDHGVAVLQDPQLVSELAESGIGFTVCPLSNVRLKVVDELAVHPIMEMLSAGLNVSLHSDDPAYFGGYLLDNWTACAEEFGFDHETGRHLARNSISAAFLSEQERAELLHQIDTCLPT